VLGFGAPPVLGGSAPQCLDYILRNVSDQKLWHDDLMFRYHMISREEANIHGAEPGVALARAAY
jgi:hypothetical protein